MKSQLPVLVGVVLSIFLLALVSPTKATWYGIGCDPNKVTGTNATLPLCSTAQPCTYLNPIYTSLGITTITTNQFIPGSCKFGLQTDSLLSVPVQGIARYYCQYLPPTTSSKPPLVVWFPGSGANASSVYISTKLRSLASSYVVKSSVTGFALVSLQPLNRHWPTPQVPFEGTKQDFLYYKPKSNSDYIFADAVIDQLVAGGQVDPKRIYVSGWSNGAFFGMQYGITRSGSKSTPGGNKVAAVAVYSGGDPFLPLPGSKIGSCTIPYPSSTSLPIYLLGRDCDLISCPNAITWMDKTLAQTMKDPSLKHTILDANDVKVSVCQTTCPSSTAMKNHMKFPSLTWQQKMLDFLAGHPLPK